MRVKKFEARTMKEALLMVKHELGPDAVILAARDNRKSFGLAGEGSVEVTAAVSENTLHRKKFVESRLPDKERTRFQQSPARTQKQIIEKMTSSRLRQHEEEQERRPITSTSYIDIPDEELHYQHAARARATRPAADAMVGQTNEAPRTVVARPAQRPAAARAQELAIEPSSRRPGNMSHVSGRNVADLMADLHEDDAMPETNNTPPPMPERAKARIRNAVREAWRAGLSTEGQELVREVPIKDRSGGSVPPPAPRAPGAADAGREFELINLKNEVHRLQKMVDGFQKVPQTFVNAHPGAEYGIHYDLSFMFQKLHDAGISTENVVEILSSAQTQMDPMQIKKRPLVDAFVARWFLNHIQVSAQPLAGRVHCFVGGSGSGKTSALVKMASHLVVREKKKVAVLTTDSFKVGAADQLKIYCQILNVPFAIVRNAHEWEWVLAQLGHVDHILVDFPGLQLGDLDEIHRLRSLLPPVSAAAAFHLVMPATAKDTDAAEIARRYKITDFADLIFTNLDQSIQHGVIYNLMKKTMKPLHSFGTGARIPEDFETATKERVLDLIFRLTRIRK
ncbi:MAG: flagellar biosynthesis protein FlhF [Bdellovibrionaceae bacterium]|nr:flagellar biosynthesis protein FlhF [Pseudobdellovibrionaceae bacterium]